MNDGGSRASDQSSAGKADSNRLEAYYRGRKAMVTGGLGFIGSNVGLRLVELGAEVLVVDCLLPNTGANRANVKGIENKLEIHLLDLKNCEELAERIGKQDVIFNLAGRVSHLDSMTDPVGDLDSNLCGHVVFLECCRKHAPRARVVYASTRQIYGRPDRNPVDESHPKKPVDVNGINKMAAEEYHRLYHEIYALHTVCLRLTNTIGPRMRIKDARQTFLGVWLRRVLEDDVFEVWGGHQKRDLTYVDDAVDALLLAGACAEAKGGIFNVGGCPPLTLLDLAKVLVSLSGAGRFAVMEFPPERLRIDIGDYFADDRAFRELTGWNPRTTLREGLLKTLSYYRNCLSDYI
jgi:UDP-glucose 4-epimerase